MITQKLLLLSVISCNFRVQKVCKDTKSFSYVQARAHFISKKVLFCALKEKFSTFNFQLSTFITIFAS